MSLSCKYFTPSRIDLWANVNGFCSKKTGSDLLHYVYSMGFCKLLTIIVDTIKELSAFQKLQ